MARPFSDLEDGRSSSLSPANESDSSNHPEQKDRTPGDLGTTPRAMRSSPDVRHQFSKRDQDVRGAVHEENFRAFTNADISRILKAVLREFGLKPGEDMTKACLDRIRRAKGYPLSREIRNKRSTQT